MHLLQKGARKHRTSLLGLQLCLKILEKGV